MYAFQRPVFNCENAGVTCRLLVDTRILQSDIAVGVVGLDSETGRPVVFEGIKAVDYFHGVIHGAGGHMLVAMNGFCLDLPPDDWPVPEKFVDLGAIRTLGRVEAEFWQQRFAEFSLSNDIVVDAPNGVVRRLRTDEVRAKS